MNGEGAGIITIIIILIHGIGVQVEVIGGAVWR